MTIRDSVFLHKIIITTSIQLTHIRFFSLYRMIVSHISYVQIFQTKRNLSSCRETVAKNKNKQTMKNTNYERILHVEYICRFGARVLKMGKSV